MTIKYDADTLKFMSLFETITRSKVKDCFYDKNLEFLTFIVEPGELGKALGKKAINIKNLERQLKKRVRVIEFSADLIGFIRNMILPLRADSIEDRGGVIFIKGPDTKTKGLLIGRNASNLRNLEENIRRFFEVKEIKVI